MNAQNKRIEWIDIAKGFGMILVIAGHCFNKENPIHNWIFSFHMPLFFALSGYCFNPNKYKNFYHILRDKSRSLLVPYMVFCLFGLGISLIIPEWKESITFESLLVDIYTGYPKTTNITSIWYLVALFILSILLYVVLNICNKTSKLKYGPYVFVALSGFFGYFITIIRKMMLDSGQEGANGGISLPGGRLPLTIDTCMTALVFFFLGYLWKQNKEKVNVYLDIAILGLLFGSVNVIVALGLNSRVNLHGCTYGNIFFFYMGALSGVAATCIFANAFSKVNRIKMIKSFILLYGRESLFIMGMQSFFIHIINYYINYRFDKDYTLYESVPWKLGIVYFVLITIILVPIAVRVKKKCLIMWKIKDNPT